MSDLLLDIDGYNLTSISARNSCIEIYIQGNEKRLQLLLENVANYRDLRDNQDNKPLSRIRIDDDLTTYGLDFAIRLKRPEIKNFKVLYLFKQGSHSDFLFKALAEEISIIELESGLK